MFLYLFLLFWLSISREVSGRRCVYSEEGREYSLKSFDNDQFEMELHELESYEYDDDDPHMCRVEIYVGYESDLLIISFADSFEWSELDDGEARLDFLMVFNQTNIQVDFYNVLEYACYDDDECDRTFVLNHIHWLRQVNYQSFEKHLRRILQRFERNSDKITVVKCSSGVCSGKYSNSHKNYFFECHRNDQTSVEVHITTSFTFQGGFGHHSNIEEKQIVRYTCQFDRCNSQILTDFLVAEVQQSFPLEGMKDAFLFRYRQNHSFTDNFTDLTTTTRRTIQSSSSEGTTSDEIRINLAHKSFSLSINHFFLSSHFSYHI